MLALFLLAASVFEAPDPPQPKNRIDELVFANLQLLGIQPAALSSDAVFLRRAFLEITGTLPTADEARQFLAKPDRSQLIDNLLQREEFADYWANKWSDLLRVKAEFPINLWPNAAQAYHHWILASFRQNKPYDQFVREMLTESGSNFRNPPVNFYRAMQNRDPQGIAQTVALTFMGVEKLPTDRLAGLASFFSRIGFKETNEWKEEIVLFDRGKPAVPEGRLPDGTVLKLAPDADPREAFANWLISPKNPWFARTVVNRIWNWLLGGEIDSQELLSYLERELVNSKYDLKHIYRIVLNSTTFQLSPIPKSERPDAATHFACYPLRRLDAEVLIDALNQITGTEERYSSAIPEPYTFMPDDQRAIALPDGSISSSFLELFGRPARDTGLESERVNRMTDAQRLHLLNSSQIQRKIEQGPKIAAIRRIRDRRQLIDTLYLSILSRLPTPEEVKIITARPAQPDLPWALINSTEFLYRH